MIDDNQVHEASILKNLVLNSQKLYESDKPLPKFNSSAVTSRLGRAEPHESSISGLQLSFSMQERLSVCHFSYNFTLN